MINYNNVLSSYYSSPGKNIFLSKVLVNDNYHRLCLKTNKNKKISFSSASRCINQSEKIIKDPVLNKKTGSFINKIISTISKNGIGQNTSNMVNYLGKAVIAPVMVLLAAPFTNEKKDSIVCSALTYPIQSALAIGTTLSLGAGVNKVLDNVARNGKLGTFLDKEMGYFFDTVKNPAGKVNLTKFKDLSTIAVTAAVLPVTGLIYNWMLPKLKDKVMRNNKACLRPQSNMYAENLRSLHAERLNPLFGSLTVNQERYKKFNLYDGIKKYDK